MAGEEGKGYEERASINRELFTRALDTRQGPMETQASRCHLGHALTQGLGMAVLEQEQAWGWHGMPCHAIWRNVPRR